MRHTEIEARRYRATARVHDRLGDIFAAQVNTRDAMSAHGTAERCRQHAAEAEQASPPMRFRCHDAGRAIRYYACALNDDGRIGLLLVHRENGWHTQNWTGETFPNTAKGMREAERVMIERNCPKEN